MPALSFMPISSPSVSSSRILEEWRNYRTSVRVIPTEQYDLDVPRPVDDRSLKHDSRRPTVASAPTSSPSSTTPRPPSMTSSSFGAVICLLTLDESGRIRTVEERLTISRVGDDDPTYICSVSES